MLSNHDSDLLQLCSIFRNGALSKEHCGTVSSEAIPQDLRPIASDALLALCPPKLSQIRRKRVHVNFGAAVPSPSEQNLAWESITG